MAKNNLMTEMLAKIRGQQSELAELEEDVRPSASEEIEQYKRAIAAHRERYASYLCSFHQAHFRLLEDRDDPKEAAIDFLSFHSADQLIATYSKWRTADSAGMATAERQKKITALKAEIEKRWAEFVAADAKIQAQGEIVDWPADVPVTIFLRWDQQKRHIGNLELFRWIHKAHQSERAANDAFSVSLEEFNREKIVALNNLRLHETGSLRPVGAAIAKAKAAIGSCDELRNKLIADRNAQRKSAEGMTNLFAACALFLRKAGIPINTTLLLTGTSPAAENMTQEEWALERSRGLIGGGPASYHRSI